MRIHDLDFYTSYSQFYLYDKDSPGETHLESFWSDEAHQERLAIEQGVLGVGTECYGPVTGELMVLHEAPTDLDPHNFDHIVEGSIAIQSGYLQILNCPESDVILEIELPKDNYRCRIYSSNLDTVMDDEGDDYYHIAIWPQAPSGRKVLKQY